MCSLGHHDHPEDVPALAKAAPREVIAPALSQAELGDFHGDPNMEPLPPGADMLPSYSGKRWWRDA